MLFAHLSLCAKELMIRNIFQQSKAQIKHHKNINDKSWGEKKKKIIYDTRTKPIRIK